MPRIVPFTPDRLEAVVTLSLRAWAPVFVSLKAELLPPVYEAFYPDGWEASQNAAVRSACTADGANVWVALEREEVAGFVAINLHLDDKMGEIYMIAVDPAHQRKGIATALTNFATDWMREQGMEIAMVETGGDPGHAPARQTYESTGFRNLPVARYFKAL